MRARIQQAPTHLGTRDPQKLAELCILPTHLSEWLHWTTWLIITLRE
ncbi:hypothetical protein AB0N61_10340 [Microbacterium sp. NPDC089320]